MPTGSRPALRRDHGPHAHRFDIAELSHDMKTPLAAIRIYNGLLSEMRHDDPDHRTFHHIIDEQVTCLTRLANRVLEDAEEAEPIDLCGLLSTTADVYRHLHGDRGYGFALDVPSTLPPVRTGALAVGRVLANLLDNAVKYSMPHAIRIRARETLRGLEPFVVVEIVDRGRGIAGRHLPRLFETGYRTDPDGPIPGSGLGLSITRDIVEINGGHVEVESAPGKGSTLRVFLPAAPSSYTPTKPPTRHACSP